RQICGFFFSSRRRHTRSKRDWSSDVCSSDLNAVEAVVAGLKAVDTVHDEALVLTNGQPRPIGEMIRRIARAGGAKEPVLNIPSWVAKAAGSAFERLWDADKRGDEPPITRFLAEQMSTAHWFDQRRTQEA